MLRKSLRSLTSQTLWLVGLATLAFGFLGGLVIMTLQSQPTSSPNDNATISIQREPFVDQRTVQLTIVGGAPQTIVVARAGTITSTSCFQGALVTSGTSPLSVDGSPILVLNTSPPLWRDLDGGSAGEDVRGLQRELTRLGYTVDDDGRFGSATSQAVDRLWQSLGVRPGRTTISLTDVAWIPNQSSAVLECLGVLGTSAAGELFTVASRIEGVSITPMPDDLVLGERSMVVFGESFRVDGAGQIADSGELERFVSIAGASAVLDADETPLLTAVLELASPIQVVRLPPSAVTFDGATACAWTPSGPLALEILGSTVGMSIVKLADPTPPEVVLIQSRQQTCS